MACETIKMEISANPDFVSIIRLTTSGIANKIGFSIDDIEDMQVAVSEACTNAIKHSDDKRVSITYTILENGLDIEIKDNGIGFTKEDLAHATELFYQGDKSRKSQKNHGIGLYSVKKIMEFHHGEILLKNRENGQGAIVVMKLPLSNK